MAVPVQLYLPVCHFCLTFTWTGSCVIKPEHWQLKIYVRKIANASQASFYSSTLVFFFKGKYTDCSVPAVDWTTLADSLLFSGYPSAYTQLATKQISVFLQPWAESKAEPLISQHPFVLNLLQRFSNLLCPRLTEGRGKVSRHTCLFLFFLSIKAEWDLTNSYMTHEICNNKMIQWFIRSLEQAKLKKRWTAMPSIPPLVILLHACCQSRPFDVSHSNNSHHLTVVWTVKHWGSLEGFQRCFLVGYRICLCVRKWRWRSSKLKSHSLSLCRCVLQ